MKTICIAGVGLIGGSFALALRKAGFTGKIIGASSPRTLEKALALGTGAEELSASWGRRHAIVDSELDHRRFLEIAAASAVKAAVYLDLYQQKPLVVRVETTQGRDRLSRIIAMLNGF